MATQVHEADTKSVVEIDFASNNELAALFSRKNAGDKCSFKLEMRLMSKTQDGAKLSIEKVITEDSYDEASEEIEPDVNSPVMMTMKRKKAAMGGGGISKPTENSMGTTSYA